MSSTVPPPISNIPTRDLDPVEKQQLIALFQIHAAVCGCDFCDMQECTFDPNTIACTEYQDDIYWAIPSAHGPSAEARDDACSPECAPLAPPYFAGQ